MSLARKRRRPRESGPFFGPLLRYDLVRSSRSGQIISHRCFYALVLFLVLALGYQNYFSISWSDLFWHHEYIPISQKAGFASSFFANLLTAQLVIVLFITPLYTAGAIAEEKERRTLEFLFVTDLSNREIILGMLGARLGKLLLLLLTGLPFLSLLELMGGVDPNLVIGGFLATALVTLSVGSISILVSVYARSSLSAVVSSYLFMMLLAVSLILPFYAVAAELIDRTSGNQLGSNLGLVVVLLVFAGLHGAIAFFCCRGAIAEVRREGLKPRNTSWLVADVEPIAHGEPQVQGWGPFPQEAPAEPAALAQDDVFRRPVGKDALLWKEIHFERGFFRMDGPEGSAVGILVVMFAVLFCLGIASLSKGGEEAVRTIGMLVGGITLLLVGLSAAGRIIRERERGTLDDLLALPVSEGSILFAKWLGSILSVRWLWLGLALVWVAGVLTGVINVFALPLLLAACFVYGAFLASLGLWFSALYRSRLRASLFILLISLLMVIGPGAFLQAHGFYLIAFSVPGTLRHWLWFLIANGSYPAGTVWSLTFRSADILESPYPMVAYMRLAATVLGLHLYMAMALLFWLLARQRLRRFKGA